MVTYELNQRGPVAQGELLFLRIDSIPTEAVEVAATNGQLVVGHSETGHSHVVELKTFGQAQLLKDKNNNLIGYLKINEPVELKHLRTFDTHESILFPVGNYRVRYRAEDTPSGWQQVLD